MRGRRHRPADAGGGVRRDPSWSSTPPPAFTSGARWTTSFESTSAGTANVLDAAAEAGADRVVHLSSVVVYGYESRVRAGRGGVSPRPRNPVHRHQVGLRPAGVPARRGRDPPRRRLRAGLGAVDPAATRAGTGRAARRARSRRRPDAAPLRRRPRRGGRPRPGRRRARRGLRRLGRRNAGSPSRSTSTVWRDSAVTARRGGCRARCSSWRGWRRRDGRGCAASRPPSRARAATFIDRRGTVSAAKAREQLGWEPLVSYEEGMRRTEQWLRAERLI